MLLRVCTALWLLPAVCPGALAQAEGDATAAATPQQLERRASRMVASAVEMINGGDEARGESLLDAIPRMFPGTQACFKAHLELGRRRIAKGRHDDALAQLRLVEDATDDDLRADALNLRAAALQAQGRSGEAVSLLRRITLEFPASAFADDAYFGIGQIHFEAGRWTRALEAFERVGTAAPGHGDAKTDASTFAEAGQRLFAQVSDRDLEILRSLGETSRVMFKARSGDVETVDLDLFGRGGSESVASVETVSEPTAPEDGKLTVQGGDDVIATYTDKTDAAGEMNVSRTIRAELVSTGVLAFMDGAGRQSVRAVFSGQPAFLRLRDLDLDTTGGRDQVAVKVVATFVKPRPTSEEIALGAEVPAEDVVLERSSVVVQLVETAERSGEFEGRITPMPGDTNAPVRLAPNTLVAEGGDTLTATYVDKRHLGGGEAVERTAAATVVAGGNPEPQSIVANSSDPDVQSRKLLLEAQLLHKLGSIFKDVGLDDPASAKAAEGLRLVSEIMELSSRSNLDRSVIEQTFVVKWNLQLLQDKLHAAIETCQALVRLYPDTVYADLALMRIAAVRIESDNVREIESGINVYRSVLRLPNSGSKAEAQYGIALAYDKLAKLGRRWNQEAATAAAMQAFRTCAETYPDSSFAGESFKRIVEYQIGVRDYSRAVETLERVFADYPDAPWLDEMLMQWGIVLYRQGDRAGAAAKFQRVLEEYPGGQAAPTAAELLKRVR
ncbi:MAG: tetratricopeptide repeat protein [Lentisphaerae bacterium]|nr:tetratricopeptide repeat protein [Lentisphaerota bacterium]